MTVPVERWTARGTRYLVVDAAHHVPDRRAFAGAHCGSDARDGEDAAAAVLFLALDPDATPPRVVTTLVGPTGRRVVRPPAARVAAAWAARRTGAGAAMVDAPRGTLRAAVADSPPGWAVAVPDPRTGVEGTRVVEPTATTSLASVSPRVVE